MNKIRNIFLAGLLAVLVLGNSVVGAQDKDDDANNFTNICNNLAQRLGGIPVVNGAVCDVVVVRKAPTIKGTDGMTMNQFTLMNSVAEFTRHGDSFYVMGDFGLLETEFNPVLDVIADYDNWTITGAHNHMILESPKTIFVHWEAKGSRDRLVEQINRALAKTSIK